MKIVFGLKFQTKSFENEGFCSLFQQMMENQFIINAMRHANVALNKGDEVSVFILVFCLTD